MLDGRRKIGRLVFLCYLWIYIHYGGECEDSAASSFCAVDVVGRFWRTVWVVYVVYGEGGGGVEVLERNTSSAYWVEDSFFHQDTYFLPVTFSVYLFRQHVQLLFPRRDSRDRLARRRRQSQHEAR